MTFRIRPALGPLLVVVAIVATAGHAQISDDPFTIAPGRTQFEIDFLHTHDRDGGTRTDSFNAAPVLITHGLTERADVGMGFDGYYHERTRTAGATTTANDWGDLTLRAKYSLWGHHRAEPRPGDTACALLPYVILPLRAGDAGSDLPFGGVAVPLAVTLPADGLLVVMTQFDAVADAAGRGREFQWVESLVISRPFSEKNSAYAEFYSVLSAERGRDWDARFNVGFYHAFTPDFCFDVGCNVGLTRAAPDLQPFVGLTYVH